MACCTHLLLFVLECEFEAIERDFLAVVIIVVAVVCRRRRVDVVLQFIELSLVHRLVHPTLVPLLGRSQLNIYPLGQLSLLSSPLALSYIVTGRSQLNSHPPVV